jgi:5-methyltetrahydropteroyltriglutamate--homocysteine methyltransferase
MTPGSRDHFLTTHTGSLPRPERLLRMMFDREAGETVDEAALESAIDEAVRLMVERQRAAGLDIVNDGEMSKPSYATYIKDRLDGFGGESGSYRFQDLEEYPGAKAKVFADSGRARRRAPACNAPIRVRDMAAPRRDAERLAAVAGATPTFMSAASPGVTALFFPNQYYPDHETYLFAIADALRHEYETIAAAGITLQIDCPDPSTSRRSTMRWRTSRRKGCACICAGAIIPGRTTATCRSPTSSTWSGPRSRRWCCSRRPIPATPTSSPCSRRCGRPRARSSSPA